MKLSDAAIRRAKPAERPQKLSDGGGLYLLLQPNGSRWWRLKYRIEGKEKLLSLGVYPTVTLAMAREARDDAKRKIAQGIDPSKARRAAQDAEATPNTFEAVGREWVAAQDWVPGYREKVAAWLDNDVFPYIGAAAPADLTAADFLKVARRIEKRGAYESAHRIIQNCSKIMRYATAIQLAARDPIIDLRGALKPVPEKHHAAIVEPEDLAGLLRAIDAYAGTAVVRAAFRAAPYLFQRPGEVRHMEWSEVDLDQGLWNIPAEKMKMRRAHIVPLSTQVVEILRELAPITGRYRFVFPGHRDPRTRPMSENAITAALRRMGFDKDTMTNHGFRATARTILDERLRFRPDVIDHQLAHTVKDTNGRAYNRTKHLGDRIVMMQVWADYLDALRAGTAGAFVDTYVRATRP